ncbi:hypothetical protein D3C71_19580 [compost metagenome]
MENRFPDTFRVLKQLHEACGLEVTPPQGASAWCAQMACATHDAVPYCMSSTDGAGGVDPNRVPRGIHRRQLIIERHHSMVKPVYDYCMQQGLGPVWAMCGGGAQLQVFFGNAQGYIAILYLSLEAGECDPEYLKAVGNETFSLVVQGAQKDKFFEGFDVPGVRLRTYASVFGR